MDRIGLSFYRPMAARVTVTYTGKPLKDLKLSTKELMREVGLLARERVYRRTISGVDEHGSAFAPYSPLYALRKAQEVGSASVNLQLSGAMLNAMTVIAVTESSVTLGFSA